MVIYMELEWMGEYRNMVEQIVKYCNGYASQYKIEDYLGTDEKISYAQVQVLEYILENEQLKQNMTMIAARLGITNSTFSKLVTKLVNKGMLQRYYLKGNKRNIIIQVTEYGKEQYEKYSRYTYKKWFEEMFIIADQIPKEYITLFSEMLRVGIKNALNNQEYREELIPVDKAN